MEFTPGLAFLVQSIEKKQLIDEAAMLSELRSAVFKPYFQVRRRFNLFDKTCFFIIPLTCPIDFSSDGMGAARGRFTALVRLINHIEVARPIKNQ